MIRKVPDAIESFQDVAAKLLLDRHHGVLLTGVALMTEICAVDPAAIEAYRKHVPQLCNIMRSLLMSGFAPEHDVSGITDPFLQVKVSLYRRPKDAAARLPVSYYKALCSDQPLVEGAAYSMSLRPLHLGRV